MNNNVFQINEDGSYIEPEYTIYQVLGSDNYYSIFCLKDKDLYKRNILNFFHHKDTEGEGEFILNAVKYFVSTKNIYYNNAQNKIGAVQIEELKWDTRYFNLTLKDCKILKRFQ